MRRLYLLFFVSGFPALLYQVVWQRALFAIYGINVESVTVVVTAFMLGLGLGSLLGGWLSTRARVGRLTAFGVMELGVGAFGLVSLATFAAVGEGTAGAGTFAAGLYAFLLVLLPTVLMGATLPLLTAYLVQRSGNVGRSVGVLYFVNTLGSAVACIAAGLVLLGWLGQSGTVTLAASINLLLGAGVLLVARREQHQGQERATPPPVAPAASLARRTAVLLSAAAGFIALSYEILWFRVFSFTSAGEARSFALLLGAYLLGLAVGSVASRRFCARHARRAGGDLLRTIGRFVVLANLVGFLVAPLLGLSVTLVWHYAPGLLFVALAAAALGTVFPLLCHVAIPPSDRAGHGLAQLYVANIVGSAAGSFVTGFVLMDALSLSTISVGLATVGVVLGGLISERRLGPSRASAALGVLIAGIVLWGPQLYDGLYERLHFKTVYAGQRYRQLVETKSGVIAVTQQGLVYGGGIYDGEMKTTFDTLADDSNMLWRTYALSALHPAPEEILVIGLGSGSWTKVLAAHPQVRRVTVVEINPGYFDVIRGDPVVGSVLTNEKVTFVIDDGRRWMRANPGRRFDAIVSNTTFNWRSFASGLLGVEWLELCRAHLEPQGVLYYNTTWHPRVQRTGASVFPHALLLGNFLAVSDSPLVPAADRLEHVLRRYQIDGRPAVGRQGIGELVRLAREVDAQERIGTRHVMETGASILARTQGLELITDDNMGTEWDWLRIDSVDGVAHP